MPNAACGQWCSDIRGGVQHICNLPEIPCTTVGKSHEQMVDQIGKF